MAGRDLRLPSDTVLAGDRFDILILVRDGLMDALEALELAGKSKRDALSNLTGGQLAVWNLEWLRDFIESDGLGAYCDDETLSQLAELLPEHAVLVGAAPFAQALRDVARLSAKVQAGEWQEVLDELDEAEARILQVEVETGRQLWDYLADYVLAHPDQFVIPH